MAKTRKPRALARKATPKRRPPVESIITPLAPAEREALRTACAALGSHLYYHTGYVGHRPVVVGEPDKAGLRAKLAAVEAILAPHVGPVRGPREGDAAAQTALDAVRKLRRCVDRREPIPTATVKALSSVADRPRPDVFERARFSGQSLLDARDKAVAAEAEKRRQLAEAIAAAMKPETAAKSPGYDPVMHAISLLATDPARRVTEIAAEVGVTRSRLYRDPRFRRALQNVGRLQPSSDVPGGYKDRDGSQDAYA